MLSDRTAWQQPAPEHVPFRGRNWSLQIDLQPTMYCHYGRSTQSPQCARQSLYRGLHTAIFARQKCHRQKLSLPCAYPRAHGKVYTVCSFCPRQKKVLCNSCPFFAVCQTALAHGKDPQFTVCQVRAHGKPATLCRVPGRVTHDKTCYFAVCQGHGTRQRLLPGYTLCRVPRSWHTAKHIRPAYKNS